MMFFYVLGAKKLKLKSSFEIVARDAGSKNDVINIVVNSDMLMILFMIVLSLYMKFGCVLL